tara:strand:+ start:1109 stop:2332 length:1224 start_codon:yes stop_codon:yes gene_type:complete
MKILFLTDNFPPEVTPPATRTFNHCKQWIKDKNTDVTIITSFPNFPFGRVYKGYKNQFYKKDKIGELNVIRVWTYMAENAGVLKRIIDQFSFALTSFFFGLFQKYDIIIATSPQFFTTWSAFLLSKIRRKPWIFELRDIWPESIYTLGVIKNKKIISFLEKIELYLYNDADLIIPVTNAFKDNLVKRGINPSKIYPITNGVNSKIFYPKNKNYTLAKQLNLNDKFVVGYIGTHGIAHGLDFIVKAIRDIDDESIHFLFVGDGSEKNNIKSLVNKYGLKNITFIDSVSQEAVSDYISVCDLSLVCLKRNDTFKSVIPSKIFSMAAVGKPILLGVEGESKDILIKYNAGLTFIPENQESFISQLLELKNNKDLYAAAEKGCIELAKDFDSKRLANNMLRLINNKFISNR